MATLKRPEGAETWEIRLHAPNLRASFFGILSCLEAYRITGDQKYLDQAVYWATVSLPHIYWWGYANWPLMPYSTISVANHEWWPGKPVQWVGLQFAESLFELSEFDQSFPWQTVAEGITVAGMWWQYTEGERLALYPDFLKTETLTKDGPGISPTLILNNLYRILDVGHRVETEVVPAGGKTFRVSASADIIEAKSLYGILYFETEYFTSSPYLIMVADTEEPSNVTVNGNALESVVDIDAAASGWFYDEQENLLLLKVISPDGAGDELKSASEIEVVLLQESMAPP